MGIVQSVRLTISVMHSNLSRIKLGVQKSLMAEWLEQVSQCSEVYCHDLGGHEFETWLGRTWSAKVTNGRVVRAGVSVQ